MTLAPGEEIGAEVHEHNDQVLTCADGALRVEVAGETADIAAGDMVIVAAGTRHNVTNIGAGPARLYTLYGPPDHAPDTVHLTKADADAAERQHSDVAPAEHD